jgi:hypothetical protein
MRDLPATLMPVRAELIGDDTCVAAGQVVKATAPVLAMCRRLIAAGHDPGTPLEAWRGEVMALRVRSLGGGARLIVKSGSDGVPRFVLRSAAASPVAPRMPNATPVAKHGDAAARASGNMRVDHAEGP